MADIIDGKAIGGIAGMILMGAEEVIAGLFILTKIADHMVKMVAEVRILIKTEVILPKNVNLLRNNLYLCPHRLYQLVSSKGQQ